MNNETNLKPLHVCSSQQLELKNASLRAGDQLKVKLFILHDAERCAIQHIFSCFLSWTGFLLLDVVDFLNQQGFYTLMVSTECAQIPDRPWL